MITPRRLLVALAAVVVLGYLGYVVLSLGDERRADFRRMHSGMTLEEAQALLGFPGEEIDTWVVVTPTPHGFSTISDKVNRRWESGWTTSGYRSTLYAQVWSGKIIRVIIHDTFVSGDLRVRDRP